MVASIITTIINQLGKKSFTEGHWRLLCIPLKWSKALKSRTVEAWWKQYYLTLWSLYCVLVKPSQQTYEWVVLFPFSGWENWPLASKTICLRSHSKKSDGAGSKPKLSGSRVDAKLPPRGEKECNFYDLYF